MKYSVFLVSLVAASQCTNVTVRKSVDDMTEAEWKTYLDTIKLAQKKGIWESAAKLHEKYAALTHGGAQFHFWHRMFLTQVERDLQALNPDFFFPYFDSPRWHSNWWVHQLVKRTQGYSSRDLGSAQDYPSYDKSAYLANFENSLRDGGFATWAPKSEGFHSRVHNGLGGDMESHLSPRDPVFYAHHAFVDYEWAKVQVQWKKTGKPQYGRYGDNDPAVVDKDTKLAGYQITYEQVLNVEALCVRYAHPGEKPVVAPKTTSKPAITSTKAQSSSARPSSTSKAASSSTKATSVTKAPASSPAATKSDTKTATASGAASQSKATETATKGKTETSTDSATKDEPAATTASETKPTKAYPDVEETTTDKPAATTSSETKPTKAYPDVEETTKEEPAPTTTSETKPTKAYPDAEETKVYPEATETTVVYAEPTPAPGPKYESLPVDYKPMSAADCKTSPKWAKWAKMNNFPASYAKEVEKTCLEGVEKAKKGKVETVPLYTEEEMAKVAPVTEPVAVKPLDIVSNANTIKAVSMTSIVVFASLFL